MTDERDDEAAVAAVQQGLELVQGLERWGALSVVAIMAAGWILNGDTDDQGRPALASLRQFMNALWIAMDTLEDDDEDDA